MDFEGIYLIKSVEEETLHKSRCVLLPPTQTLPALVELVQHEDLAVKVDACWALSFLADGKDRQIQVTDVISFEKEVILVRVINCIFC